MSTIAYRVTYPNGSTDIFLSAEPGITHVVAVKNDRSNWSVYASGVEKDVRRWQADADSHYGQTAVLLVEPTR